MSRPTLATFKSASGVLLLILFFLALVYGPQLFQKTNYEFPRSSGKAGSLDKFPLDLPLAVLYPPSLKAKKPKLTLGELANYFKKENLLICLWATWCPPCLEELPSLELLNRQLIQTENTNTLPKLVTISVDELPQEVDALYQTLDFKPSFIVLHDPGGRLSTKVGTDKFPETYLVHSNGKVAFKWMGPQDWLSYKVLARLKSPHYD